MYANLHNHSTHSDGVYNVEEITDIALGEGYRAMALTDHDTVTGNAEMAVVCEKKNMGTLYGCEFMTTSAKYGVGFHLTAFDFDADEPEMREYLRRCSVTMTEKTKSIFEIGKAKGLLPREISWDDVVRANRDVTWLCNDHVFRTMKKMGLAEDKDYPPFLENIFFKFGKGLPDAFPKLPLEELVPLIRRTGGIVIVAHPHKQLAMMPYLIELGVSGLEVWHPDLIPEEIPEALKIAKENNLYISGGTDHSGLCGGQYPFYEDYKNCEWYVPELSMGTTKELYEELRCRSLMRDRAVLIGEYLEYYGVN